MALVKRFDMELNKLFYRRTSWLKAAIGKKLPGRPHEFNRKQVYPMLDKLGEIAAAILVKRRARGEFSKIRDVKRQWQVKRGKGHGVDAKQESFKRWTKSTSEARTASMYFGPGGVACTSEEHYTGMADPPDGLTGSGSSP